MLLLCSKQVTDGPWAVKEIYLIRHSHLLGRSQKYGFGFSWLSSEGVWDFLAARAGWLPRNQWPGYLWTLSL